MQINYTTIYFKDNRKYMERHGLVQYEYGQYLELHDLMTEKTLLLGEFYDVEDETVCYPMQCKKNDEGNFIVRVPDELLKTGNDIICYVTQEEELFSAVIAKVLLKIEDRPDGEDYDSEEYKSLIGQLFDEINNLEENIEPMVKDCIGEVLEAQIDLTNYYTKEQTDEKIQEAIKDIPAADNYATKEELQEIENKIPDTSNFTTKQELQLVEAKIPDTSNFTTKSYVDSEIAKINGVEYIQLTQLPEAPIPGKEQAFYLIATNNETDNMFDEYIWIDNKWELFGTAKIDLSNYYSKTETDNIIKELATKQEIKEVQAQIPDISGYATKTEVENVQNQIPDVSGFAKTTDIPDVSGFATKQELEDVQKQIPSLEGYAKTTDIPDITGKLDTKTAADTYATKTELSNVRSEIPSLNGLATQVYVQNYVDTVLGDIETLLAEI